MMSKRTQIVCAKKAYPTPLHHHHHQPELLTQDCSVAPDLCSWLTNGNSSVSGSWSPSASRVLRCFFAHSCKECYFIIAFLTSNISKAFPATDLSCVEDPSCFWNTQTRPSYTNHYIIKVTEITVPILMIVNSDWSSWPGSTWIFMLCYCHMTSIMWIQNYSTTLQKWFRRALTKPKVYPYF